MAASRSILTDCKYRLVTLVCSNKCFRTSKTIRNSKIFIWILRPRASATVLGSILGSFSIVSNRSSKMENFASTALKWQVHLLSQTFFNARWWGSDESDAFSTSFGVTEILNDEKYYLVFQTQLLPLPEWNHFGSDSTGKYRKRSVPASYKINNLT